MTHGFDTRRSQLAGYLQAFAFLAIAHCRRWLRRCK